VLKGLTIDYDPLPYTQGRIIEISGDKMTLKVQLLNGYPESDTIFKDKVEIYDQYTDELATNTFYGTTFTLEGPQTVVIHKQFKYDGREKIGDIAVIASKNTDNWIPHAIQPHQCTNLVMEGVTLYASQMFGFFETNCEASQYLNCVVDRRDPIIDLYQRDYRRLTSLMADAFHSKHASIGPKIIGCTARYNGDDEVNINGDYHIISGSDGSNRIRVVGKLGLMPDLNAGDTVELVTYYGERVQVSAVSVQGSCFC
jgi:hypothetical protein